MRRILFVDDELAALCQATNVTQSYVVRQVRLDQLTPGMVLAADVRSLQGTLLCAKGHEVSRATCVRLRNFVCNLGLQGSIEVFVPDGCAEMADLLEESPSLSLAL